MNPSSIRIRPAMILILAFCVSATSIAPGQEQPDDRKQRGDQPLHRRTLQLVDGPERAQRNREPQVTTQGKIRTTTMQDRGREVKIVEDPDQGILIEVTQYFGPAQLQQLKDQHPELRDFIDLFPTSTGDHEIELNIGLKKKFEAANPDKLRARSVFAFGIYRRHIEQNGDHLAQFQ